MINSKHNRWFFFFLGLALGTALTVFVFSFLLKPNYSLPTTQENKNETVIKKPLKEETPKIVKKKKRKKKKPPKQKPVIIDSLQTSKLDSLVSDSLLTDSIITSDSINTPIDFTDIVVVQDELLFSKQMIPSGNAKVFLCDNSSELDSLLVDNITSISGDGLSVEFWKSPVNFKGYKLNKKKLILFGIMEFDSVSLEFQKEKSLILHYRNQDFELKCTQEFLPLNIQK